MSLLGRGIQGKRESVFGMGEMTDGMLLAIGKQGYEPHCVPSGSFRYGVGLWSSAASIAHCNPAWIVGFAARGS